MASERLILDLMHNGRQGRGSGSTVGARCGRERMCVFGPRRASGVDLERLGSSTAGSLALQLRLARFAEDRSAARETELATKSGVAVEAAGDLEGGCKTPD